MLLRKITGFILGFAGACLIIVLISAAVGFKPIGFGWFMLMMATGGVVSKFFAEPRKSIETSINKVNRSIGGPREQIKSRWWSFEPRLRLLIVAVVVWVAGAFFIQDGYSMNFRIIFLPVIGVIALYYGHRYLVVEKSTS